ncbi:hypothetical protein [uncultured Caballeronia sp.]|uniref:hypothetical protein n=1 Tax=uncultured Caballeronia sp. TaxID=1827198 RepID=UPI001575D77C
MLIEQAISMPKGRAEGADFKALLYSMIESGFVANAIEVHGVEGPSVDSLPSGYGALEQDVSAVLQVFWRAGKRTGRMLENI